MLKSRAMDTPVDPRHAGKMVQNEKTFGESTLLSISYNPVAEKWKAIKINIFYANPPISVSHLCNSSSYAAVVTQRSRNMPYSRASWNISFQTENFGY